jgi:hypothetical protein
MKEVKKMKTMMKHVFSATLLVVVCGMFMGLMPTAALGVDFGLYKIFFLGANYDEDTDATTFSYEVRAAVNYGFDDWTIELNPECFGPGDVSNASEPYVYVGPDPITGIYGLTFTTPYAPGETRIVWFEIPGNLAVVPVKVDVRLGCTHWTKEIGGPDCPGQPGPPPPPPSGEGKSPGYWKNELARYLGYKQGKMKEPDVAAYAAGYGYTAQEAYNILNYGGNIMLAKLHRQVVAAKLSTAAGYLSGYDAMIEQGQYMVAHPMEFTPDELENAKDEFEALHD